MEYFRRSVWDLALHGIIFSVYGVVKYIPSPLGDILRYSVLKPFFKKSCWCMVKEGATFYMPYKIIVGHRCSINEWVWMDGAGGIEIGDWVRIGHRTSIISGGHRFRDGAEPIKKQGSVIAKITIGDNVWIGANVTVLKGVTIGAGAVVAAGAVVTRDVPENSLVAGVPASVIGRRGD